MGVAPVERCSEKTHTKSSWRNSEERKDHIMGKKVLLTVLTIIITLSFVSVNLATPEGNKRILEVQQMSNVSKIVEEEE